MQVKAKKLSANQKSVYEEMLRKPSKRWSAHHECKTMNALAKAGLVELIDSNLGVWQVKQ